MHIARATNSTISARLTSPPQGSHSTNHTSEERAELLELATFLDDAAFNRTYARMPWMQGCANGTGLGGV